MIRILSNITRMLVDLQQDETLARRLIVMANLNPTLKETLVATKPGEWFFGSDLIKTLKATKSLEKSSRHLKPVVKTMVTTYLSKSKKLERPTPPKETTDGDGRYRRPFTPPVRNPSRYRSSSAKSDHSKDRKHCQR